MIQIRRFTLLMFFLAVLSLGYTIGVWYERAKPPVVCFEDEPCFDCATMGNLICGTPDE